MKEMFLKNVRNFCFMRKMEDIVQHIYPGYQVFLKTVEDDRVKWLKGFVSQVNLGDEEPSISLLRYVESAHNHIFMKGARDFLRGFYNSSINARFIPKRYFLRNIKKIDLRVSVKVEVPPIYKHLTKLNMLKVIQIEKYPLNEAISSIRKEHYDGEKDQSYFFEYGYFLDENATEGGKYKAVFEWSDFEKLIRIEACPITLHIKRVMIHKSDKTTLIKPYVESDRAEGIIERIGGGRRERLTQCESNQLYRKSKNLLSDCKDIFGLRNYMGIGFGKD